MARVWLKIEIEVLNHEEVIKAHAGEFASFAYHIPFLGDFVQSRVDARIEKEIKAVLADQVKSAVEAGLAKNKVEANVDVSYPYTL